MRNRTTSAASRLLPTRYLRVFQAFLAALVLFPSSVTAHHALDRRIPSSFTEGILSGFAHPVIGSDHLTAILAVGLLAAMFVRGNLLPLAFLAAAFAGVIVHAAGATFPFDESLVALSLVVLAAGLWWRANISVAHVIGLFAAAGFFHGYAYGEAIVGAEATPLAAYLAGLTVVQYALSLIAFWVGRYLLAASGSAAIRSASALIVLVVGVASLFTTLG